MTETLAQHVSAGTSSPTSRVPEGRLKLLALNEYVLRVIIDAGRFQQKQEFLLKASPGVMLRLIADVIDNRIQLRRANTEGAITLLPFEIYTLLGHPSR